MVEFVKRMINEHSELVVRIQKLHNYIYSEASNKDNKTEFANKCIQLSAMKKYEEALQARLENQGVFFENNQYFKRIQLSAMKNEEALSALLKNASIIFENGQYFERVGYINVESAEQKPADTEENNKESDD